MIRVDQGADRGAIRVTMFIDQGLIRASKQIRQAVSRGRMEVFDIAGGITHSRKYSQRH